MDWEIQADEFVSCNCAYGCPCQFNAPPTHGSCQAIAGFSIINGHFGNIPLSGLKAATIMSWPGAIHEGNGKAVMIIDQSANEAQRQALFTILNGELTDPGATVWNVFATTLEQIFQPEFKQIDLDVDVEQRTGGLVVDGLIESVGEPIRNPVTGQPHRARIDLPDGFEYTLAEMGSATSRSHGPIELSFENSYAQFAHIHLSNHGVVKH